MRTIVRPGAGHGGSGRGGGGHRSSPALRVCHLAKSFGPVRALRDVSFELNQGEVLGLLGDNGAGKSTLVNCLSGVIQPDAGTIEVDGERANFGSPHEAQNRGIEAVHQDLALVGSLDVAGNLFLHRELTRGWPASAIGWLDKRAMAKQAQEILASLRIDVPSVNEPVDRLSGGQRQAVAVGRAATWGRHIVLMDEPAAALGVEQAQKVLSLIKTLAAANIAVLLISHNMQHVMSVCDRAVVLRHGMKVGDLATGEIVARDLVDLITGSATQAPGIAYSAAAPENQPEE